MSKPLCVEPYREQDAEAWDRFLAEQSDGLDLLHTRRFLSHRQAPFADRSLILRDARGAILGVLPAAQDPDDPAVVVSHPGLTYGGLVGSRALRDGAMLRALEAVGARLRQDGARLLRYKPVPAIYRAQPREDDIYALHRLGGRPIRCDLGAALDLAMPAKTEQRRRRALKRAASSGLAVERGGHLLEDIWPLITATFADRMGARPTHSLGELQRIRDLFPGQFDILAARLESEPVAGVVLLVSRHVARLQYIVSSAEGYARNALDPVIDRCIADERGRGRRYLDFGTSTLDAGRTLSDGVQGFKAGFGAGSILQQVWELEL